jgi:putative alpha-1,2-mannosidase
MSAFLVFSMMGFFPVSPGIPEYAIGSPFFEEITLNLPSGKHFTVKAENFSEDNIYVQKALLNGKELDRPFITHDDLLSGGTLTLEMGYYPKK